MNIISHIVRFIVAAIVLMITSWIVPSNFQVGGFGSALFLALIIALLGWIIEGMFGKKVTPFGRGITGFIISAFVIYISQFIAGYSVSVTFIGAILAALIIGLIDLFMPLTTPFELGRKSKVS